MPGQAELLVKRMKSNSKIDFDNDWKVITLFVGGNDLCRFCYNKAGIIPSFTSPLDKRIGLGIK